MYFYRVGRRRLINIVILLLLVVLFASFFVFSRSVESQTSRLWSVYAHVWNERLDLWGITDCSLASVSGCGSADAGAKYHHNSAKDADDGKLSGGLWSPVLSTNLITFDESEFPSGESCYGLSGTDRQPRLIKVGNAVRPVGCAYSSLLGDYILLSSANPPGASVSVPSSAPSSWGVQVAVDGVTSLSSLSRLDRVVSGTPSVSLSHPYLTLSGCGWSSSSGFWSFGGTSCFPSSQSYSHPGSGIGQTSANSIYVQPQRSSARIGQRIAYRYGCPYGYDVGTLTIDRDKEGDSVFGEGVTDPYPVAASVSDISLTCRDGKKFFSSSISADGAGVATETILTPRLTASSSVVTEGGYVTFTAQVNNFGNVSDIRVLGEDGIVSVTRGNRAHCAVVDGTTGERLGFVGTAVTDLDGDLTTSDRSFSRSIGGSRITIDSFVVGLNSGGSVSDVVVRDGIYAVSCWYCDSWTRSACTNWKKVTSPEVSVRVLPRLASERPLASVNAPTFSGSSSNIMINKPQGAKEVYVYVLDKEEEVKTLVSSDSLHKVFAFRSAGSCTDFDDPNKGDPDKDALLHRIQTEEYKLSRYRDSVKCLSSGGGTVDVSTVGCDDLKDGSKAIVAEAYYGFGRRSQKVVYPVSSLSCP